ncbi:glycogen/starch/alpha-glucan phosphorylase [Thiospirochaeta perfilievii]|uniref:Alpha-1,4 glucan phosphorylase n=1 Tax=Thiospirochaeta perfilievii TaxID=252967 RepID=A0A5C1QEL7_9SPIO|nr:glycogen/starch/alpha-glucan phosphorylase [Thiospirochaeta perfilievii]QEN05449.1 glycogen/starch/alpha-glucan phosphorylase [Thiospirochaeta perfilievii]
MQFNKEDFKKIVLDRLDKDYGRNIESATREEIYYSVSRAALSSIWSSWSERNKDLYKKDSKQAYYFSAEFLMGRAMSNNLVNLGILEGVKEVLNDLEVDFNMIEDTESDAGLGNGGLGRLAACFLDSLATLGLHGHGYGIRYKYGMFKQKIENGYQVEYPDNWLHYDDPWSVKREADSVEVNFYGHVDSFTDENGKLHFRTLNTEKVTAVPYDMPIIGYGNDIVNTLRLWEAHSPDGFELQLFNKEMYNESVEKKNRAEDISRVLYPSDLGPSGKTLRLRQQYFFSSASLYDIIRKYKTIYGNDFSHFHEKNVIQLNDTHPVIAIPELMRILIDEEYLDWDTAWQVCSKTFAYTNHTILAEALEKWPIDIISKLLPRIYQIIEEINRRFMSFVNSAYPGDWDRAQRMSIVSHGVVKMAWLAIAGTFSVNGVAALHTEILKNHELKDWYELFPEKFNNKTNGITQRRWLLKSNPELASFITKNIGDKWITEFSEMEKLLPLANDSKALKELMEIKHTKKVQLAEYIKEHNGVDVDPNSIFDIQIKRLHEYKRQLLNVFHIMYLYNRIKENPNMDFVPRTFIFGAKAASGYARAKQIIKLITRVGEVINNDKEINNKIKVVFIENYNVSVAEKLFPACDLSEQISTAGKEASGTGNMKFMVNGAVTIGTLDGANVEIVEEAGVQNAFIFGLKADQIQEINSTHSYNPLAELSINKDLKLVIDQLTNGYFGTDCINDFKPISDSLLYGVDGNRPDPYYVIKDFSEYCVAQDMASRAFTDKESWAKMSLINIAKSGKFSSDRTINQYAKEIWKIS